MFFSLAAQWIRFTSSDRQFKDYMEHLVGQPVNARRPTQQIRSLVMIKARELSIPVEDDGITITGQGGGRQTLVAYDAELRLPLLERTVYRMEFRHSFNVKR